MPHNHLHHDIELLTACAKLLILFLFLQIAHNFIFQQLITKKVINISLLHAHSNSIFCESLTWTHPKNKSTIKLTSKFVVWSTSIQSSSADNYYLKNHTSLVMVEEEIQTCQISIQIQILSPNLPVFLTNYQMCNLQQLSLRPSISRK